jgi:hypothetical protein
VIMPLTLALFRCQTLADFAALSNSLCSFNAGLPPVKDVAEVLSAAVIAGLLPNTMQLLSRYRPGIATYSNKRYTAEWLRLRWRPNWTWTGITGGMLIASLYYIGRQPPFLYLNF